MGTSRLFWPQEILDQWIVEEKISLDGETLVIPKEDRSYRVSQAVHFIKDVGDGDDKHGLVGRVKELKSLRDMGAEHYMDSVIIEDSAYEVVPGFVGELSSAGRVDRAGAVDITKAVTDHAGGTGRDETDDKELLAKFLIENL